MEFGFLQDFAGEICRATKPISSPLKVIELDERGAQGTAGLLPVPPGMNHLPYCHGWNATTSQRGRKSKRPDR